MECTKCSKKIPDDSKFCAQCGAEVSSIEKPANENISTVSNEISEKMECKKCGGKIGEYDKFCTKCGEKSANPKRDSIIIFGLLTSLAIPGTIFFFVTQILIYSLISAVLHVLILIFVVISVILLIKKIEKYFYSKKQ